MKNIFVIILVLSLGCQKIPNNDSPSISSVINIDQSYSGSFENFVTENLKISDCDQFKLINEHQNTNGDYFRVYAQLYCGVWVEEGGFISHNGSGIQSIFGKFIKIENLKPTPSISPEKARDIFISYQKIPKELVTGFNDTLSIRRFNLICDQGNLSTRIVYKIVLLGRFEKNDQYGIIDAHNGQVIQVESPFLWQIPY